MKKQLYTSSVKRANFTLPVGWTFVFGIINLVLICAVQGQTSYEVKATGTGQTTGHIANLMVHNMEKTDIRINEQSVYIPSDGRYQSYITTIPGTTVPPGTTTIPLSGYCADVTTPPVGLGEKLPPIDTWITVTQPVIPEPSGSLSIVVTNVLPTFSERDVPGIITSSGFTPVPISTEITIRPTWPGSEVVIEGKFNPVKDPEAIAPVLIDALENIAEAYDKLKGEGIITTPFSGTPEKERESIIQQTFWIYTAGLTGKEYGKENFNDKVFEQFEDKTGVNISAIPEMEKKQLTEGVDIFWNTFLATGVEAKVLHTKEGTTALRSQQKEKTAPVDIAHTSADRKCIRFGEDPNIDSRTGFDLIGDLYRQGKIPSDYLNDMRLGRIAEKVNTMRAMHHSLKTVLEAQYKMFPCEKDVAHNANHPVSFPPFPWEDFFLTVDFCDQANENKTKLSDFIDPDADPAAITEWMKQFEAAIDNVGVWNPGETSYMEGFQRSIDHALSGIADAYKRFEESMYGSMELSFNRSRAESRLWSAVTTIVAAAVSAGIGAAAGGAWAAMASVFISGTGFVWEQGLEALGADPKVASLVASLMTLSMGVASSWGAGLVEIIGEEVVTGLPAEMISSGGSAMNQGQVEGFAMSMAMLDDEVWNKLMKDLAKDYDKDALARMNGHRETMRAEIGRHIKELCKVLQSLEALLPAAMEAHKNASAWLHSSYWKDLWQEGMDQSIDCCCEWSDGTGPDAACRVTIPPFGHAPGNK